MEKIKLVDRIAFDGEERSIVIGVDLWGDRMPKTAKEWENLKKEAVKFLDKAQKAAGF